MSIDGRRGLWLLFVFFAVLSYTAADKALWYGFVAAAGGAGTVVVLLWRSASYSTRTVLGVALALRLFVLWLPPSLSDDAYRYVWDGMIQVEGINPYLYPPEAPELARFHEEPIYEALNSKSFYSVYPPLSQYVFRVGGAVYGMGWKVSYYVIKLLLALFEVGALFLLARMVAPRMLLLHAWNPLVVIESAGQAHTEAMMVFFLVLAVWLARKGEGGRSAAALTGGAWVKLYPVVLLPLLLPRFKGRALWPPVLVSALVLWPFLDPSVPGHIAASLNLYVRYFEFNAGLYYGVKKLFLIATGDDWSKTLGPAFRAAFLLALPALYLTAWRRRWPLHRGMIRVMGVFFLFSTTVHPWYIVGLLALTLLDERPSWHWLWLGLLSMGTYLRYVDGPYWLFVNLSWIGWTVLLLQRHRDGPLQWLQRRRGRAKARRLTPYLPDVAPLHLLDLGAGEGYVGAALAAGGAAVHLADVVDLNRTALSHTRYDGHTLPFEDRAFDAVVLYFVLHHCRDPQRVFREALRVSRGSVLVVESVYEKVWDRRLLTMLDTLANRLRSGGLMTGQEAYLHFRTVPAWMDFFERQGATVVQTRRWGRWVHRQVLFLLHK